MNSKEKELRDLLIDNPELPLIIFCSDEVWTGEGDYSVAAVGKCEIMELTEYGNCLLDEDELEEHLRDDLAFEDEYENLSDKEFDEVIAKKVSEAEFTKAIVVYVG